jgi:thiol:disulfide interchange protein DsbD
VINQDTKKTVLKGVRTLLIMLGLVVSIIAGISSTAKLGWHSFALTAPNLLSNTLSSTTQSELNEKSHPEFMFVKNLEDIYPKVGAASTEGKSVIVDLYAHWCAACKVFETPTLPDPSVIKALENIPLMQIYLTDNTPQ